MINLIEYTLHIFLIFYKSLTPSNKTLSKFSFLKKNSFQILTEDYRAGFSAHFFPETTSQSQEIYCRNTHIFVYINIVPQFLGGM